MTKTNTKGCILKRILSQIYEADRTASKEAIHYWTMHIPKQPCPYSLMHNAFIYMHICTYSVSMYSMQRISSLCMCYSYP